MKEFFKKHRRLCLNTITIAIIILIVGLNILFPYLTGANADYIDLTPEGLYTLTEAMESTCANIKGDITITFCDDPDHLMGYYETRPVYVMSRQLEEKYDNIHVETVNLVVNPTAVNRFKTTSATTIEANDVIVSSGGRYRILDARTFWTLSESATDASEYYSFNGEFKLATAMLSVTSLIEPVVCFSYGHGEHIYIPENYRLTANDPVDFVTNREAYGHDDDKQAFYEMMALAGLKVEYINIDERDIPQDCVLLVTDGPTVDYDAGNYNSIHDPENALRRIHAFMARQETGSWMLFKDPTVTLPELENLAEDWGIGFDNGTYVKDDAAHTLPDTADTLLPGQKLIATLSSDENATPYAIFGDLLSIGTTPRMAVDNSGAVYGSWINISVGSSGTQSIEAYYFDYMYSSDQSVKVTTEGDYATAPDDTKAYPLAGLSMRLRYDTKADTSVFSYFFGAASTSLTSDAYLADAAFSNYDVMFATVRFISRVDQHASMELGGTSLNTSLAGGQLGGKPLQSDTIPTTGYPYYEIVEIEGGAPARKVTYTYPALLQSAVVRYTIILVSIPVVIAAVIGVVMLVKRKNR